MGALTAAARSSRQRLVLPGGIAFSQRWHPAKLPSSSSFSSPTHWYFLKAGHAVKSLSIGVLQAKHKIQSAGGPLEMRLSQVPTTLSVLRNQWAALAFCISFKLETDLEILVQKADMALKKYKMNIVVPNLLATYKEEHITVTHEGKQTIGRCNNDEDLEEQII